VNVYILKMGSGKKLLYLPLSTPLFFILLTIYFQCGSNRYIPTNKSLPTQYDVDLKTNIFFVFSNCSMRTLRKTTKIRRIQGLLRLQDLVRAPPSSKMEVYIRQGTVNTYRQVLREIKQRDIGNIIVDTRTEHVEAFFRAVC